MTLKQKEEITRHLRSADDCCFHCGGNDHFSSECNRSGLSSSSKLPMSPSFGDKKRKHCHNNDACRRCGREGHQTESCYAKRTVSGRQLFQSRYLSEEEEGIVDECCYRVGVKAIGQKNAMQRRMFLEIIFHDNYWTVLASGAVVFETGHLK